MRQDVLRVIEAYIAALNAKDLSAAPLSSDVTFESPLSPTIQGLPAVQQVFAGFFPVMRRVIATRHIIDGEWCATVLDMETAFGTVPMIDYFHVLDGQIVSIRVYFDPRPILDGISKAAT